MPVIRVTDECMKAIRGNADTARGFRETGVQLPDGDWTFNVDDETYSRILELCSGGNTVSDALLLAFAIVQKRIN